MAKRYIAVLRGGPSSEYEVSLKSGRAVKEALEERYRVKEITVDKAGIWHVLGMEVTPHRAVADVDVVFNAMHGEYGEDGQVQNILQHLGVPFTGPDAFGASQSIDKAKSKEIYKRFKMKTPHSVVLLRDRPVEDIALNLFRNFPLPVVIKPLDKGSSVGVSIARDFKSLHDTLISLFVQSDKLLVEEYIRGQEATVGVIEGFRNEKIYPLLPIEIRTPTHKDFFDYEAKYTGITEEICPGCFSRKQSAELQELAKLAHEILSLRHYSRSDFIIHPKRGIYILETNSLPGLTTESLLPKALEPIGSSYIEFLEHVIDLACVRKAPMRERKVPQLARL